MILQPYFTNDIIPPGKAKRPSDTGNSGYWSLPAPDGLDLLVRKTNERQLMQVNYHRIRQITLMDIRRHQGCGNHIENFVTDSDVRSDINGWRGFSGVVNQPAGSVGDVGEPAMLRFQRPLIHSRVTVQRVHIG